MSSDKKFSEEDYRDLAAGLAHTFGNYSGGMDWCLKKIWENMDTDHEEAQKWLIRARRMHTSTMYFATAFSECVLGSSLTSTSISNLSEFVKRSIEEALWYFEAVVGHVPELEINTVELEDMEIEIEVNISMLRYVFQSLALFSARCGELRIKSECKNTVVNIIFEVPATENDSEDLEKYFHPYQQSGTGLGLLVGRRALEISGLGTLLVRKEADKLQFVVQMSPQ